MDTYLPHLNLQYFTLVQASDFFIVWTKLAESLLFDFAPKTNGLNSLETNLEISRDADPCLFRISIILTGT